MTLDVIEDLLTIKNCSESCERNENCQIDYNRIIIRKKHEHVMTA